MTNDLELPDRLSSSLADEGVVIFLFHGVIKHHHRGVRNYTRKHIGELLFARCIASLRKKGYPLSMQDVMCHCIEKKPFPDRSFAITFDDGFENNLSVAAPILADFKVPTTIYVTTGFIDANAMSWIDRIEYAVENAPSQKLTLEGSEETFAFDDRESRIAFLKAVRTLVKNNPHCDGNVFADQLCARLGYPCPMCGDSELDLKMTWDQVRSAHQNEWITIGGHSHTHPILSYLNPESLSNELDVSISLLKNKAGIGPEHYSYPEGLSHCYNGRVIAALKQRGVQCCPTAINGINRCETDTFELKRMMVA
jgi:peptidoglycan/xylan/chitin deacetylase (PgdA/CDA1 family)